MADKSKDKKGTVLRRGMAEPDWTASRNGPPTEQPQPFRWDIPPEVVTGEQPPAETPVQRRSRRLRWIRIGVIVVVVIACVLFALQASLQGFDAEGVSMEPALHNGDHLIVNKLAYAQIDFGLLDWAPLIDIHGHWKTPGRGDVVVFKSPKDGKELVKRVVGMPGEWVMVSNDAVYIDGKQLDEPYAQGATRCEDSCLWKVPDGQYFMLGDNRENSLDSREGWTVPLSSIDGEKLFAY